MFQLSFCCFRKIDLFNDADDWWLWPALTVPRFNSNDKWPLVKPWTLLSPISPLVARCSLNELASWMIIHQTHKHVCMLLYIVHSITYKVQNNDIILIYLSRSRNYDLPWSIFKNCEPFGRQKKRQVWSVFAIGLSHVELNSGYCLKQSVRYEWP